MDTRQNSQARLDWKGIGAFLGITFGITYLVEFTLILGGISPLMKGLGQYSVAAVMWAPALATFLTIKLVTHEGFAVTNLRLGDWRPYLAVGLIIPGCFLFIYSLTWLLGLGQPDWGLTYFISLFSAAGVEPPQVPPPLLIWPALYLVSLLVVPWFNGLLAFGEELGWRGYLLPKLMPLGKLRAYLLLGIIWGMWHWPLVLVGFMYPGYPLGGVILFTLMTTALGAYINEMTLRYRSSLLAGWIHGVFNAQRLGMWALLFPGGNFLLGGFSGVLGITVWAIIAAWEIRRPARRAILTPAPT